MARQEPPRYPGKLELVATLDRTRAALSRDLGGMGRAFDLGTQFRRSYATSSWRWLVGALAVGVVAGLRLMPSALSQSAKAPTESKARSGAVWSTLAGIVLRQVLANAAEPAVSRLFGQEIDKWLSAVLRKP